MIYTTMKVKCSQTEINTKAFPILRNKSKTAVIF